MRKSEQGHPLCPMDNTHGILKRTQKTHWLLVKLCYGQWDFREVTIVYVAGTQELSPSVALAITYVSKSFFEVQMATSSSRVFSTKRECLDQNSLELSSSAYSSASLLAKVKNSSA